MNKRIICSIFLIVAILVSLTGCGKVKEKIANKIGESIVEKATGSDIKVTDNGTKVESNGVSAETGTDLKWPGDSMGNLPEPKCKITFVLKGSQDNEGCSVTFTDMKLEDAKDYIGKLKGLELKDGMEFTNENSIGYSGTNNSGANVAFSYDSGTTEGTIIYTPAAKE